MEPDQREICGYSFADPAEGLAWASFVRSVACLVEERGLRHEVLFHGTSERKARAILSQGLRPTDVALACETAKDGLGSFWGDAWAASAYAEDTVKERDMRGRPMLLAASSSALAGEGATLHPDLCTLDFPLKGLTRLDDPQVYGKWVHGHVSLGWADAMDDLSAVVAAHAWVLRPGLFVPVDRPEAVLRLVEEVRLPSVPGR